MDNKQNREFYWELKQFLNGNKPLMESSLPKQESLKDSIKKMLVQENPLHNPAPTHKFIAEELSNFSKNTMDVVVDFISNSEVELQKGKNDCKVFTSNITENLFSISKKTINNKLNEDTPTDFKTREWYQEQERKALEHEIEMQALRDRRRRQRQEREEEKKRAQQEKLDIHYGKEAQRYKAETGESLDPTDAGDIEKLRNWRKEKVRQQEAERLGRDVARLRNADPSQLTDYERHRLKMAQERLSSDEDMMNRVRTISGSGVAGAQGPTPSGGNLGDSDLVGKLMALTPDQTAIAPATRTPEPDRTDERISGSSMTRGQFKTLTGRDYNAFSDADRKIVINMAGGGKLTPGNYDPSKMSEGEAGFMTGANYAFRANERERTANAAAFRQQDAAAKQKELENTPEYKEAQRKQAAQNRANLEAEVEGDLAKEYGVNTETIRRARTAGVNPRDLTTPSAPQRILKNQMTQSNQSTGSLSSRANIVPGTRQSIEKQLKRLRGM